MSHPLAEDLERIDHHLQDLWEELRGASLFLTGGTGFFGRWLLESLLWAEAKRRLGTRVLVLTRDARSFQERCPHLAGNKTVQLHQGDVRTFAYPSGRFTHVIHAATPSSARLNEEEPEAMLDIMIGGTKRVLEFARRAGVRRFLLTSTGAVYGKQPQDLSHIPEDYEGGPDLTDARSAYAEGKRLAELLCTIYHRCYGMPATMARGFAFVGPYQPLDAHFAIGNFILDGLQGGPIRVLGDGTPYRSYLYAADLAVWLWAILLRGQPCRPYNVGSEQALSIAELAEIVAAYFQTAVAMARRPVAGAASERYVPSTQRAQQELGLQAWTSLLEALDRTVRWHRAGQGNSGK